jgi:hypothetical protein
MTFLIGRATTSSLCSGSLPGLIAVVALSLLVASCGVKNDLVKPNGQPTTKDENDPSKPPYPLGR